MENLDPEIREMHDAYSRKERRRKYFRNGIYIVTALAIIGLIFIVLNIQSGSQKSGQSTVQDTLEPIIDTINPYKYYKITDRLLERSYRGVVSPQSGEEFFIRLDLRNTDDSGKLLCWIYMPEKTVHAESFYDINQNTISLGMLGEGSVGIDKKGYIILKAIKTNDPQFELISKTKIDE